MLQEILFEGVLDEPVDDKRLVRYLSMLRQVQNNKVKHQGKLMKRARKEGLRKHAARAGSTQFW